MFIRRALMLALLLLVSACARVPAPPPQQTALPLPPPSSLLDPDSACLRDLRDGMVAFEAVPEFGEPGSCGVANPVRVVSAGTAWNRPGVLSCHMARTVQRFETQVVAPAAMGILGQPVVRLHHAGTYDCRQQRNATALAQARTGASRGGRLSEHARGQAIDVAAFELADGSLISVKSHWSGAGVKSRFLQEVARGSCTMFNVVLTPNHDRFHQDHLHLDVGPHRLCGY